DPLASGMLPLCLGEATKIAGDLLEGRKCYTFTVRLGERSATGDREGEIVERIPVPALDAAAIEAGATRFLGSSSQIPPMYSAIKQQGQPLYKLARKGIEVERVPRSIDIASLELQRVEGDELSWRVLCSKGTYVRVLAEDLARVLGTCGHVVALRREYVEPFAEFPMLRLEAVTAASVAAALVPADAALPQLPGVEVDSPSAARLRQGQALGGVAGGPPGRVKLYEADSGFFGLGELDATGTLRPSRLFNRHE
ncbi:MAG: tRNA pseudouridine(55) synthase TruB, partial [Steroidobacteraceae bacterium]